VFKRLIPDQFILILLATIALASFVPAQGMGLDVAKHLSNVAIFSLFFFHGLRLAHQAVWDGLKHWRLQFAVLPLLGLAFATVGGEWISPQLWLGVLFLCVLPSTVQAAIASSSMAGGNVAASVIAAALSNLAGVILTPLLFALLARIGGTSVDLSTVGRIAQLLLLPFILGQFAQRWLFAWAARHKTWIGRLDRTTIVITVFVTFSIATNEGLWQKLSLPELGRLLVLIIVLLALALALAWAIGRLLGFDHADRATLLFSGAHKSLATGAPMATILFPAAQAGMIVIPLMLYHQLQLMISAVLAARLGKDIPQP
jgi:solute carrier family 10 (sodium/bile acid cotransporter), member 7